MTTGRTESTFDAGPARRAERSEDLVWWSTWIGLILAAVGLVAGVATALEKKVVDCPNGTMWPNGTTDFNCYVHPQAGSGVAIAALSVALGIVVVFSSITARAALETLSQSP